MIEWKFSKRLSKLPPYLFAQIDAQKQELKKKGVKFYDLSIGDPDILAPQSVVDILSKAASIKDNQKYSLDQGKVSLRKSIREWFRKRFNVELDYEKEILPLIGSKEGLVHLPLAFVNPQDYVIIPNPGYPGYRPAGLFSGARLYELPLLAQNEFLPDLKRIPLSVLRKAKIIYINYPNNPTTQVAPKEFLEELVKLCIKYKIIIAYDNAYSEIYFEDVPHSILEIEGAKEVAIEFHSFSKTFCMTGFRIGWACGNSALIQGLLKVKSNIDSGIFGAVQEAGIVALEKEAQYVDALRKTIRERRDIFVQGLREKGFNQIYANSTFYVWVKIPNNFKGSLEFSSYLLKKNIVSTPGIGFGKYGEGYVRFALTVDKEILKEALTKL